MDIQRPQEIAAQKRRRRILIGVGVVCLIAAVTVGLAHLGPAAPSVERGTVWIDTVKRGPMLRQVRGSGTLVPTQVRWIPATIEGRVERVLAQPGTVVSPDTVLLELVNPELDLAVLDAESAVKAAEAELTYLRVQLQSDQLNQQAAAASVQANYHQARLQAEANEAMAKDGLIADLTLKLSQVTAQELANRSDIENKRVAMSVEAGKAQLAVQANRVDQLRAAWTLRRSQRDALTVRAGIAGVLQQLPLEAGQRVTPGTTLAMIAEPGHLKAEIRIPETQASEIQIGQPAAIDTRNGLVPGRVVRIDPAAQNGTVTVDVSLEGALPKGARPDLGVDGTITLESLENVLYVGRPAVGQGQGSVTLFKLVDNGAAAIRVPVKLGRASVGTVEIVEGLQEKDQVILSDTTAQDGVDRIRLN